MLTRTIVAVLALLVTCILAPGVEAHPVLKSANPPAEGTVTSSPTEIRLSFSEGVIPKFSGLEVRDQIGKSFALGTATADPKDKKQLVVPISNPLPPGTYTVDWHVVSVDTHRVKGTYSFKVDR